MKYCLKCGSQNEDSVKFCISCGNKFEIPEVKQQQYQPPQPQPQQQPQQQQPQQQQPQQQQYQQPQPQYQPPPVQYMPPQYQPYQQPRPIVQMTGRNLSSNPAVNILKKAGSSSLFAAVTVMFSIKLLLQIIQIIVNATSNPFRQIISYMDSFGILDELPSDVTNGIFDVMYGTNVAMIIANIIGLIIPVLICVGLWMHFAASRDERNEGMKLGGITIIKVCTIINFVFACIGMLLLFVLCVILIVAAVSSGYSAAIIAVVVYIVIVGGVITLVMLYYLKLLKSINAVKNCVATGTPNFKMSVFVPVMHFIFAFFGLIGLISSVVAIFYGGNAIWILISVLSGLLDAVILVLISVAMLAYNSKLQSLAYSQRPPVQYQQPPVYNPYNQNQNQNPGGF